MRVPYRAVDDLDDVLAWQVELGARSVVFDVEPLVAVWDTDEQVLRAGVELVVDQVAQAAGVDVVGFATNSLRHLQLVPRQDVELLYLSAARKPFALAQYEGLPHPGIVVGDQIATDGVLARRLGFAFAHVQYSRFSPPRGPRLMRQVGKPLRGWLFS
jgi:predicted HAD superfamily phosphohydrolase YqeG